MSAVSLVKVLESHNENYASDYRTLMDRWEFGRVELNYFNSVPNGDVPLLSTVYDPFI